MFTILSVIFENTEHIILFMAKSAFPVFQIKLLETLSGLMIYWSDLDIADLTQMHFHSSEAVVKIVQMVIKAHLGKNDQSNVRP